MTLWGSSLVRNFARVTISGILFGTATLFGINTSSAQAPKIAIIYDVGGRGDGGSDDAAAAGVDIAKKKFGLNQFSLREFVTLGTEFDRQNRIEFAVKSGYQLVIAIGPNFKNSMKTIASKFPESQYAIVDNNEIDIVTVTNLAFKEDQGSYLAGALAALSSKNGKIAFIGESSNNQADLDEGNFFAGAKSINPKIQTFSKKLASAVGMEVPALSKSGVDVIFSTWSKSGEVLSAVVAQNKAKRNLKYIGVTPEQFFIKAKGSAPFVIGYINKSYQSAVLDAISSGVKGESFSDVVNEDLGTYGKSYNLSNGGTTFLATGVTGVVNQKLAQIKAKLISGGIKPWKK